MLNRVAMRNVLGLRVAATLIALLPGCAPAGSTAPGKAPDGEIDLTGGDEERLDAYSGLVPCSADPEAQGCQKAAQPSRPESANASADRVWEIPLVATDPIRGEASASVVLNVFSDFECPHCKRMATVLDALFREFPGRLAIVWKDDPLPQHARAEPAALFARAVQAQLGNAGFWAAHDALYESQPHLEDADLEALSTRLGVDWARVRDAMSKRTDEPAIKVGMNQSRTLDLRVTPTLFISGHRYDGARTLAELRGLVERAMKNPDAATH